jgi:GntR family transcriptional regulator/MocR family aminotransferase
MPPLQVLDETGSVIYLYSFWKVLYPICTTGCMVLPPHMVDVFARAKVLTKRNFPIPEHYVLTEFIGEGHLERHIRKVRGIYERRRQKLIYALAQNFKTGISYHQESAGLHLLVRFNIGSDDAEIKECASLSGLPIVSTRPYYVGESRPGEFLVPFASIREEDIDFTVQQMADALWARQSSAGQTEIGSQEVMNPFDWYMAHCSA